MQILFIKYSYHIQNLKLFYFFICMLHENTKTKTVLHWVHQLKKRKFTYKEKGSKTLKFSTSGPEEIRHNQVYTVMQVTSRVMIAMVKLKHLMTGNHYSTKYCSLHPMVTFPYKPTWCHPPPHVCTQQGQWQVHFR